MIFFTTAVYFQFFGSFLIAACGLWFFAKRGVHIKMLGFYGLTSFLLQIIQDISINLKLHVGNLVGNISSFLETLFLLFFFYLAFSKAINKRVVILFLVVYTLVFIFVMPNHHNELISSIRTLRDVFMILCSLLYFYSLLQEMPTNDITRFPPFWMVSSILFYFSCTFILSLILDYLIKVMNDDLIGYWTYRNFMRFGFCIGISYGLWLDLKTRLETARQ